MEQITSDYNTGLYFWPIVIFIVAVIILIIMVRVYIKKINNLGK
jgi:hypothetical protein